MTVTLTLTIPRALHDACGSPAQVKAYLLEHGVWPQRVLTEHWELHPEMTAYLVELECSVPEIVRAKEPPHDP